MLLALLSMYGVYIVVDYVPTNIDDANLTARAIDTIGKEWFNGYLGLFFRFRFLGNINWLMLPILIHFALTLKQRERWEKALMFIYLLSVGLIALQGYFNFRYAQTLLPITIVLVMVSVWRFFDKEEVKFLQKYVLAFIIVIVSYNTYHYSPWGQRAGRVQLITDEVETADNLEELSVEAEFIVEPKEKPAGRLQIFKAALFGGNVPNLRSNRDLYFNNPKSAADILQYIDDLEMEEGKSFLCNNIPMIYYYTNKRAIYYWCEDDLYYVGEGLRYLLKDRTEEEVKDVIQNKLNCSHILTRDIYNVYDEDWAEFLKNQCTLEYKDGLGYEIYNFGN